ncbi:MAG TPA: hypothetical protein ENN41_11185 [Sediminispirochaeta sp.]|nr:hypothetical protein [Sediminispirochaeta sp.]
MMIMKNKAIVKTVLLYLLVSVIPMGALDIVESELETVADQQVEFINYQGPHAKVETTAEIRGIGTSLSRSLVDGETAGVLRSGFFDKYEIKHIVGSGEQEGLNADMFLILPEAQVDHIDNIRRILSSFMQENYGINADRADALAVFTTVYNAIHRSDMEYFSRIYNPTVLKELDREKAGMSRSYNEWPGTSQILIPLSSLGRPSAETLGGDEKVLEEIRDQEDRGIDERKEIVEMREEELAAEREALEEEKTVSQEREADEDEFQERDLDEEVVVEEAKKTTGVDREEQAESLRIQRDEEEPAAEVEELEEESELVRRERELYQREEQISQERERIAQDEEELIEQEEAEEAAPQAAPPDMEQFTPFILVREQRDGVLGTMVLLDRRGSIRKRSQLNSIRNKQAQPHKDLLYVIAGEDAPPRLVKIVALDQETLEVRHESNLEVFQGSSLLLFDEKLYSVFVEEGEYYLGRFSEELEIEARYDRPVARYSSLLRMDDSIVVQNAAGRPVVAAPEDFQ